MTTHVHPLKDRFDAATARWERVTDNNGQPGRLEIGRAADGLIALRHHDTPNGPILIYTPDEWDAFTDGVNKGEFEITFMEAETARAAAALRWRRTFKRCVLNPRKRASPVPGGCLHSYQAPGTT
jgi:hypothetical protein